MILFHRLNLSILATDYYTKEWREKFYDREHAISWSMYNTVSDELKKRKIDPHAYLDIKSEPPILIGGIEIEFAKDGKSIEVGCEEISYDTIHKIYTRIVNKRNEYVESQE